MKKTNTVTRIVCALLCVLLTLPLAGCGETKESKSVLFAMDTTMTLVAYGKNRESGLAAAESVIYSMDAMLDPERESSTVWAINHANGENVVVPGQVADMLAAAKQVYQQSGGALDLTVYPLLKLWGFIDKKYYVPYDSEILDQLSRVCFDKVVLTSFPSSGTYTVSMPSYGEMSFGAVAKGCAADKAIAAMRAAGVTSGIVSLGGNVQTLGLKPDGTQWRVGIEDPNNPGSNYIGVLNVGEAAIVTSGSYQRFFTQVATGNTYHHILKPSSGYPVSNNLVSVTIICRDGTMADCLSTAMFVLGEVQSLNYWRSYGKTDGGGFDMILITKDNRVICTKGLIEDFTLVNEGYTLSYSE
jgi:thiamine biosynthesis lipoprotein